MNFISKIDYKIYYKKANIILGICFLLLILVLIPFIGSIRNGSRSWFGIGPFGIQPSEAAKLGLIIFTSKYLNNSDKYLKDLPDEDTIAYLKDFGAATASNGAVGLYHIDKITPEAKELSLGLIKDNAKEYIIDDAELERIYQSYPIIWKKKDAKPKLCFIGCPHMSLEQLKSWTINVDQKLKEHHQKQVTIPTVFTAAPGVIREFSQTEYRRILDESGVVLSYICPLMYMNNPACASMPVITSSNKLRTYTSARFYTEDEILDIITKEASK